LRDGNKKSGRKFMAHPELLAPAGDLEKLETALDYGADAIYVGAQSFGLRARAGNFGFDDLARAKEITARRGKKIYLTLNAYLRPGDMEPFAAELERLKGLDLDAYIVADAGALALVRSIDPTRTLHLSTQANTTNPAAAVFWAMAGVRRINLARELDLEEIRAVRAAVGVELEVFVHGAMCVAWSGRCLLSAALTGRSANQGDCSQPCRWRYALMEETRPGEYLPIEEDERGSYLFNSRDLCLLEHLPALVAAGVNSVKIEGRMKSHYYVAAVTRVYRAALDRLQAGAKEYCLDPQWLKELQMVSHRPYDTGFLLGRKTAVVHTGDSKYRRTHDFIGIVREIRGSGEALVEGRNRFFPGEELQLIGPAMRCSSFLAGELRSATGDPVPAGQPNLLLRMQLPTGARQGDLLRRERRESGNGNQESGVRSQESGVRSGLRIED
jgi:U32 family peptidase